MRPPDPLTSHSIVNFLGSRIRHFRQLFLLPLLVVRGNCDVAGAWLVWGIHPLSIFFST